MIQDDEENTMTEQLTDERLAEIREWRDELGASRRVADGGPYSALRDAVAEIERLRGEVSRCEAGMDAVLALSDDPNGMASVGQIARAYQQGRRAAEGVSRYTVTCVPPGSGPDAGIWAVHVTEQEGS